MNITGLLGSWVVYSGELARACGGVNAAIFASYVAFRSNNSPDGWVPLTQEEIERGTALSVDTQQTARTRLKACKLLEERSERLAHKFYYRLNEQTLRNLLVSDSPIGDSPIRETAAPDSVKVRFGGREDSDSYLSKEDVKEVDTSRAEKAIAPLDGPVPEWLTALRKASPYKLTAAKETALIRSVSTLGCAPDRLMSAAESLASQWPYKQHKHIDMTLLSWLRRNGNGNGTTQTNGGVLGKAESRLTPANPNADYSGWRKPMGLQGKPVPTVDAPRDSIGPATAGLLDVPPRHAAEPRGKTAGG